MGSGRKEQSRTEDKLQDCGCRNEIKNPQEDEARDGERNQRKQRRGSKAWKSGKREVK